MSKTTMHQIAEAAHMERVAQAAAREVVRQSGEHDICPNEGRLQNLENTVSEHTAQLGDGKLQFLDLRKDLQSLTEKVSLLITAAWWLIGVIILGVLGTAGTALVWGIRAMGHP